MDDVLLEIVLRRLEESPLTEEATCLLLAALEDEESLSAQLGGQDPERPSRDPASAVPAQPAGAYLRSLTVTGFRGIGQPATLTLALSPGLTLVVGRNGSGKSSFAEALEVLLTGDLRRWEKLSAVWHQGWRSMHHPDQAEITAEFLVEGAGRAVAKRTWPAGAGFTESSVSVQVAGEKRAGLERLEWSKALADYRPFLSHSELEAFFGSPSGLYELLASVLGLEDLTSAAARLAQARRTREAALTEVRKQLPGLLGRLESADDDRAAVCREALDRRTWDLAAARSAATGAHVMADGGELDRLRRIAQLTAPTEEDVRAATAALRRAADQLEAVAGSPAGRARALAGLLTAALRHHEAHGDGDCPVCGQPGALSPQWRQATEQEVARLGREAQAAEAAELSAAEARQLAGALVQPPPPVLAEVPPPGVDPGPGRPRRPRVHTGRPGPAGRVRRTWRGHRTRPGCGLWLTTSTRHWHPSRGRFSPCLPWLLPCTLNARTGGLPSPPRSPRGALPPRRRKKARHRFQRSRPRNGGSRTPPTTSGTSGLPRSPSRPEASGRSCAKRATWTWARSGWRGQPQTGTSISMSAWTAPLARHWAS